MDFDFELLQYHINNYNSIMQATNKHANQNKLDHTSKILNLLLSKSPL